ncbi:hypothetical protein KP509_15G077600 [Ceratopteris richardii]|uniref:Uncharacterized protein n=1 Tax=Ceratopteris richardii TaxID=49495 RepID=A0A8T2T8T6_CERRI|nr:hypothetical protein KP509_15G077600 [Ceratopteris richardii]
MEKENELHFSSSFDIELFFDHVYNAAYDIFEDSFDTFEENVPLLLGNINEGNVNAIAVGFNSIFNTIQEKLEKNLNRWEEYSRANCFINTKEADQFAENPSLLESDADSALQRQEESVDAELEFVRSQLHAAGKESARLRRELRSLERILAVKQKREAALHDAASHLESSDQHDMLEVNSWMWNY